MRNNTELPIFNEYATCPACGCGIIECRFIEAGERLSKDTPTEAHIKRYCTRCGYKWTQAPLFTAEES